MDEKLKGEVVTVSGAGSSMLQLVAGTAQAFLAAAGVGDFSAKALSESLREAFEEVQGRSEDGGVEARIVLIDEGVEVQIAEAAGQEAARTITCQL